MTFSERSNFTLFRPTTARKPGPAVTMATAEPLDHAESLGRAWKSEWLARDTPGGGGGRGGAEGCVCVCVQGGGEGVVGGARERPRAVFSAGEPQWDAADLSGVVDACGWLPWNHANGH